MRPGATPEQIAGVRMAIEEMGFEARPVPGRQRTAIGIVGNEGRAEPARLSGLPGVAEVIHVTRPYRQVSREWCSEPTIIQLPGGVTIGGGSIVVMAGPCSIENEEQLLEAAVAVRDAGASMLRAGAFKPRSSPYAFQGLGLR